MTKCILKTSLPAEAARLTNMLEAPISDANPYEDGIPLTFHGFEGVTVRISL
jgi:hypothetical protein